MQYKGRGHKRFSQVTVGVLSAALVGIAATPVHAESARSQQWHLDAMQADSMWKTSKGKGVTVAVIDSGVDSSLPGLRGRVLAGKDLTDRPGDAHDPLTTHGTGIASLIADSGGGGAEKGTYGLAPGAKILPIRVKDNRGDSANQLEREQKDAKMLAASIRYAAGTEAKIINISLGTEGNSSTLTSAVNYALSKGKMIFAAVGNTGDETNELLYPAATPGVIGVSAINKKVEATDESQNGSQVDLAAPGDDMIHSCKRNAGLCRSHGTSDAAAIASASAALIWSKHPDWTANQVTRVLVNTASKADPGKSNDYTGHGVIRPRIALKNPGDPGDPKTNPLPGPYNEDDAKKKADAAAKDKDDQAAPAASDDGGTSTGALIGYGLGGAAVLGAAIAVPLLIRRRRTAQPTVARGYQQPAATWQTTPPPPPQHHPNDQRH